VRVNMSIDRDLARECPGPAPHLVKRILRKHGYPQDKQEKATRTVLEHAEVRSREWASVG
jgi:type I restriction enzyme, R subunit